MNLDLNLKSLLVIALAAVLGTASVIAQEAAVPPPHSEVSSGKMAGMGDQSMQMMAMHEQMMADMKAADAKMDLKVAAMNAAKELSINNIIT